MSLIILLALLSSSIGISNADSYPIVLLHGIMSDKTELEPVANWLMDNLLNKVYNIDIGNGKANSIFKTMDWQLNELCNTIYSLSELEHGFHFIGMSQGGLLARGYVEHCNKYPVINLITWVTPHAGVCGIKDINVNIARIYTPIFQNLYSFAGYWKDPNRYNDYLQFASYLPQLNNDMGEYYKYNILIPDYYELDNGKLYERVDWNETKNKENIMKLKNFVMIWSPNDDVLQPPESGKFAFYQINSNNNDIVYNWNLPIIDLFETESFREDWLGLRTLWESGRLHILETNCTHTGHKTQACFEQLDDLTFPFLI
jgi:palmitoyl-protein thioesterase